MAEAFPLRWPDGWPRVTARRNHQHFSVTPEKAMYSLFENLKKLRATQIVISSNCKLRQDGRPYAEDLKFPMKDPGVACYFQFLGKSMVMAQDLYGAPFANMRSLALAVEALRTIERHGGGHMMQRSFDGFAALPPPGGTTGFQKKPWREVLKFSAGHEALDHDDKLIIVEAKYKQLARAYHPDQPGGSADMMAELNIAIEDARKELGQ